MLFAQVDTTIPIQFTGAETAGLGVILFVYLAIVVVALVVQIGTLVSVIKTPDAAWAATGQQKNTWLIVSIGAFFCTILFIGDIYFLAAIRPKLKAAAAGGMPTG